MTEVMRMLRKEHTDMAILLDLLERQIAEFKRGGAADFGIVRDILDYYLSYPDLYHHPKEDLIYHRLRAVAPDQAESVKGLLAAEKPRHGPDPEPVAAEAQPAPGGDGVKIPLKVRLKAWWDGTDPHDLASRAGE